MTALDKPPFGVFRNGIKLSGEPSRASAEHHATGRPGAEVREIDYGALRPELEGLEGWRVEVTTVDGNRRRFIVGKSTGWKPIHLEISRRNAHGGMGADSRGYADVTPLYKVR